MLTSFLVIGIIPQNKVLKVLKVKDDFVFRDDRKLDTPCLRQLPNLDKPEISNLKKQISNKFQFYKYSNSKKKFFYKQFVFLILLFEIYLHPVGRFVI